ncbi:MAG: hypothetical protein LBD46_04910 [Endomicrobium sp.]|nr:hypothetical protein [Endomicrobium sp.]
MRKLALAVCSMFVMASLSFAGSGMGMYAGGFKDKETKEEKEARKEKMEAIKKDYEEFQKNIDVLIEKYNNANDDADKESVKGEIRGLVAVQTDKNIAAKKDMLEDQKARISKLETKITDLEANKDKYIDEKVDFFTSAEGQAKMKEMREKKEKKEKTSAEKKKEKKKKVDDKDSKKSK